MPEEKLLEKRQADVDQNINLVLRVLEYMEAPDLKQEPLRRVKALRMGKIQFRRTGGRCGLLP